MKKLIYSIILVLTLAGCHGQKTDKKLSAQKSEQEIVDITVFNADFPLRLTDLNFRDSSKYIALNDGIETEILHEIQNYYGDQDSSDFYLLKDSYITTVRLHEKSITIFLILLRHQTSNTNSKVLFYDNTSKEFIGKAIDFNLHALYNNDGKELKATNLKEILLKDKPEIELLDDDNDGQNEFKFTRLYHNGTANAIETTILKVHNNKMDTIDFRQK